MDLEDELTKSTALGTFCQQSLLWPSPLDLIRIDVIVLSLPSMLMEPKSFRLRLWDSRVYAHLQHNLTRIRSSFGLDWAGSALVSCLYSPTLLFPMPHTSHPCHKTIDIPDYRSTSHSPRTSSTCHRDHQWSLSLARSTSSRLRMSLLLCGSSGNDRDVLASWRRARSL